MQIFKCITDYKKDFIDKISILSDVNVTKKQQPSQNMIEFVFVFPILIFLTLVIFEIAFFWQETNAIYNLNAEINANVALLDYSNMTMGSRCPAANKAIEVLKAKDNMISMVETNYNDTAPINDSTLVSDGKEPFALYRFTGGNNITASKINGITETSPQIQLLVDCRNPFEDGITTQIEFYHKTLIMKATIPRFDQSSSEGIVIIPDKIFISSPKLNTIRHY